MTIKELQKEIHSLAREKGWYDSQEGRKPLEMLALIMSEIGEAVEEVRKDNTPYSVDFTEGLGNNKPEGEFVELADAIIRILDYAEYRGVDMAEVIRLKHEFNKTRSYRHGGKKY
jgi:NTP pyrophosphatase (non-canonical NTP hydrolase)